MRGAISTQCVRTRARRELCCELHVDLPALAQQLMREAIRGHQRQSELQAHLPALAQQRVVHRLDFIGGELPVAVAVKALDELL
jgi:hypothetical protein